MKVTECCKQEKDASISATVHNVESRTKKGGHRINPEIQVHVDEGLLLE
jgi:hypothetical protein